VVFRALWCTVSPNGISVTGELPVEVPG